MTRGFPTAFLALLPAAVLHADDTNRSLTVGQIAPPLKLAKLLQAPYERLEGLDSLKGQVICLEFWATWCAPCRKSIPHLNELAEKLADKPVQFISVSSEDESVIRKFCAKNPIRGWIGLDLDKSTSRAFGVKGIPYTVLIDRAGRVAGVTSPEQVTERHILDVLADKRVRFKPRRAVYRDELLESLRNNDKAEPDCLFVFTIHPSRVAAGGRTSGFPGTFDAKAATLRIILSGAYGVRLNRVEGSLPILDQTFDVKFQSPLLSGARAAEIMQESLCAALCLSIRTELREVEAFVMTLPGERGEELKQGSGLGSFSSGLKMNSKNYPISHLAASLEDYLGEPVLDETGLEGGFDYEVILNRNDPQTTFADMEKRLGLKVIRAKRPVEFLIVDDSE